MAEAGSHRWGRVLLTGAAGEIGTVLRPALRPTAHRLRLLDRVPVVAPVANEEAVEGDITSADAMMAAMKDVDCIVHLAGIPREGAPPEDIFHTNVLGCHVVYEAARQNGVRRMIFASSNHVIGFYRADTDVGVNEPPRPDGYYGVSKVFGEAMGRLCADKFGMEVACLRIGSFRSRPEDARQLGTWISHGDMARLARCCVEAPAFHYLVLYGLSANRRARWGDDHAARTHIGYQPQDNAEDFAAELEALPSAAGPVAEAFHGGPAAAMGFVGDPARVP